MRVVRFLLSTLFLTVIARAPVSAQTQVTPDVDEGMKAFGDFYGGNIDQVSLSSGKLVLNIPLISYPQRGGKIKLGFGLRRQNITPRQTEVYHPNTDFYQERAFRDSNTLSTGKLYFVDDLAGWLTPGPSATSAAVTSPDNNMHNMLYVSSHGAFESNDATGLSYSTSANALIAVSAMSGPS